MQNLNSSIVSPTMTQPLLVAFGGFALVWMFGRLAKRYAYARYTIVHDLPALGRPRRDGKLGQTAVVCGGSIAGLLSARVLSDHFEEVIVIDPDADVLVQRALADDAILFPNGKEPVGPARPRVMQWTAYHLAQPIYFTGLDRLFPSLRAELAAANVPVGPADINLHIGGVHRPMTVATDGDAVRTTLGLTRAAHETLVRRLVSKQCTNVRFVPGTVLGLDPAADRKTLEAVRYRPADDARKVNTIEAALVLDCSGAASAGLGWLQRAGYPLAKEEIHESYHPHMRYTSCTFRVDPDVMAKIKPAHLCADSVSVAFFIPAASLDTRHFAVEHVEGNRLSIAAGGAGFDHKITSVDELRAHVESIRQLKPMEPWVFALLDYLAGEPAVTATYSDNQISALHRLKYSKHAASLPNNFVALGDAAVRLNPVNGQGMAKAAVEVIALDGALRKVRAGRGALPAKFAAKYFAHTAAITDRAWNTTKAGDYANDSCTPAKGESLDDVSTSDRLIGKLIGRRIMSQDADIWRRARLINEWVMPANQMMAPTVVAKLAWDLLRDALSSRME